MNRLTVNMTELGEMTGRSRWVVQGWIRQGLPYIPTGRKHKLILVSVAEQWLKSRQVTAKGAM